jgi:hypothetical protein
VQTGQPLHDFPHLNYSALSEEFMTLIDLHLKKTDEPIVYKSGILMFMRLLH